MFNNFIGVGNLTRDPEIKFFPSGDRFAIIGIAFNKKFKNKKDELVERACFLDGKVFGKFVETIEQYLKKGDRILVQGELLEEHWFNQNGEKRSKHILSITNIKFLTPKKDVETQEDEATRHLNVENETVIDMSFVAD